MLTNHCTFSDGRVYLSIKLPHPQLIINRLFHVFVQRISIKNSAVADMGDRLATIDMGRKVGAAVPPLGGGAGSPSNTMWPRPRPTSVPSGILTHPPGWLQQTWAEN